MFKIDIMENVMEIAPTVPHIMDIAMDVGIMDMIIRMDVNLVGIKVVDHYEKDEAEIRNFEYVHNNVHINDVY